MRLAPYLSHSATLILGLAIGLTVGPIIYSNATAPASAPPGRLKPGSTPLTGSSAELGAILLQRVGSHLIADDRASLRGDGPISFYAVPKPYGDTLCRVDVYTVASKVIRSPLAEQEKWDDDLKIETKYGLWKQPDVKGGDRNLACSAFRDFGHLITEGSLSSVARGAFVLNTIIQNARAGKSPYKISCVRISRDRNPAPIACDPLTVLRALSLKDLYRTEMKSESANEHSYVRQDELLVDGARIAKALEMRPPLIAALNVDDEQHIGRQSADEADVLSLAIEISELD